MIPQLVFPKRGRDRALNFARYCASEIEKSMIDAKRAYVKLEGNNATKLNLTNSLITGKKNHLLAFGHGSPDFFTVHENNTPVFTINDSHLLNGKICYFLSCCIGKKIGPQAIQNGAVAFIGFVEDFTYVTGYEKDFMECSISGIQAFLLGKCTVSEIEEITEKSFQSKIAHFVSLNLIDVARYLTLSFSFMVFLS